jgi:trypsin
MKYLPTILSLIASVTGAQVAAEPVTYAQYQRNIAALNLKELENDVGTLVLSGTEAPRGKYQWMTSARKTIDGQTYCGGSLIAPTWVLSAAHCAYPLQFVNVGTHVSTGNAEGTPVKIIRKIQHPDYDYVDTGNDYLLLELEKPVNVTPVALAKADGSDEPVNATARLLGWGATSLGGPMSEVLLQLDLNIVSNQACSKKIDEITETMLCAGGELNKDSCQGDSGGPLILTKDDKEVLIGTVSWGYGCGKLGYPGVYARVSAGRTFIDKYVKGVQWL